MKNFPIDSHLDVVEATRVEALSESQRDELVLLLNRPALLRVQKELLLLINGEMNAMTYTDLGKEQALLAIAKSQGKIAGIRAFFDVITDLYNAAVQEEVK